MNWTQVTLITTPELSDAIIGILYETNVGGVWVEDPTILQENNRNTERWDVLDQDVIDRYSTDIAIIKAYYSSQENIEEKLLLINEGINRAKEYLDIGTIDITTTIVAEEDWENSWKQYYKPVFIGKNIVIKPQWENIITDRFVIIELDPGMAFGTGTHETTRMCLELLEEHIKEGTSFLDIGTGSGILAIGAAKLGANKICAVDIDKNALKVARENAQINGVADKIQISHGDLIDTINGSYDIITANIIADAIILLSSMVSPFLNKNGKFIVSGIIDHRKDDVKKSLSENGFIIDQELQQGEWIAIVSHLREA